MTTEEKAKAYAGKIMIEQKQSDVNFNITQSAALGMYVRDAYLAGAAEALRSQWRDESEEWPEDDRNVLVHINQVPELGFSDDITKAVIEDALCYTIAYLRDDRWNFMDDFYCDCTVGRWMPIPPLPNTEEQ